MLTKRQKQVLDFIKSFKGKNGYPPSLEEIKKHLGLSSVSTAHYHVAKLEKEGRLKRRKNEPRAIDLKEEKKEELIKISLVGTIAAGEPIEAVEEPEIIKISKSQLPKSGKHYALQVRGNSMIDEGIFDGDIVIIRKQPVAENGETVVALINDNEITLKKIYREKNGFRLQPANPNAKSIFAKELIVQGKVVSVIRTFEQLKRKVASEKKAKLKAKGSSSKNILKNWLNTIQNIDCIEGLKKLLDKSIDLILTDPPYGLKKRGVENDDNLDLFYSILPESYRVLKDNSFFITFFSTKFLPQIFKDNPFEYFWNFILYCPNGRVRSPIGFTKYMSCIVFKKGNPRMIKRGKDIFIDTPGRLVEPDEGFINHPTPKPKTFIKEMIMMFSKKGDIILDPFLGSGSTAVACKQTRRNFIGFEINKDYCKLAQERLKKF